MCVILKGWFENQLELALLKVKVCVNETSRTFFSLCTVIGTEHFVASVTFSIFTLLLLYIFDLVNKMVQSMLTI